MKKFKLLAFASALALGANVASAQDSALLDLLVKKKVITDQEAESTRAELAKEYASTSAGKINISTPVQQIRLYGDGRLRYDAREGNKLNTAPGASDTASANRFLYRLRLGADVKLTDEWGLGVRLETGNGSRSTNVTAGSSAATAPFGKAGTTTSSVVSGFTVTKNKAGVVTGVTPTTTTAVTKVDYGSTLFVGQLYLKYKPFSWLTVEGGKIPNPFVTTPLVWDADINPEGFAEQFKYTIGPFGGASPVAASNDPKDSKTVITKDTPDGLTVDLFANFGQFVYDTASPQNQFSSSTAVGKNDTWLFGSQIGARANFTKNVYLQIAPTIYNYSGHKNNDFNTIYNGDPGGNQIGIDDLTVVEIPVEFGWKSWGIPFTIFGDFTDNLQGAERAKLAGHPAQTHSTAWEAGLRINQIKKKGDWSLAAYYQYSGAYALDPNLVDNDIFDGHLNMKGIVFQGSYALTDAVNVAVEYNYGQIIDTKLGTGGAIGTLNGATSNPALRNYNLLQVDLNIKF